MHGLRCSVSACFFCCGGPLRLFRVRLHFCVCTVARRCHSSNRGAAATSAARIEAASAPTTRGRVFPTPSGDCVPRPRYEHELLAEASLSVFRRLSSSNLRTTPVVFYRPSSGRRLFLGNFLPCLSAVSAHENTYNGWILGFHVRNDAFSVGLWRTDLSPSLPPPSSTLRVFISYAAFPPCVPPHELPVKFVVDCLYSRKTVFDSFLRLKRICNVPISGALADLRASLAGRVSKGGCCFRLCTADAFAATCCRGSAALATAYADTHGNSYQEFSPSALEDIAPLLLRLKAFGTHSLQRLPLLQHPPAAAIAAAAEHLFELQAVDASGRVTKPLGWMMAQGVLSPELTRLLLIAADKVSGGRSIGLSQSSSSRRAAAVATSSNSGSCSSFWHPWVDYPEGLPLVLWWQVGCNDCCGFPGKQQRWAPTAVACAGFVLSGVWLLDRGCSSVRPSQRAPRVAAVCIGELLLLSQGGRAGRKVSKSICSTTAADAVSGRAGGRRGRPVDGFECLQHLLGREKDRRA